MASELYARLSRRPRSTPAAIVALGACLLLARSASADEGDPAAAPYACATYALTVARPLSIDIQSTLARVLTRRALRELAVRENPDFQLSVADTLKNGAVILSGHFDPADASRVELKLTRPIPVYPHGGGAKEGWESTVVEQLGGDFEAELTKFLSSHEWGITLVADPPPGAKLQTKSGEPVALGPGRAVRCLSEGAVVVAVFSGPDGKERTQELKATRRPSPVMLQLLPAVTPPCPHGAPSQPCPRPPRWPYYALAASAVALAALVVLARRNRKVDPRGAAPEPAPEDANAEEPARAELEVTDPRKVFVIHGRNREAREEMVRFLRALGLEPVLFKDVSTRMGAASISDIVDRGMREARGIIALFTPDEYQVLHPRFRRAGEEAPMRWQARPNVTFEAGMAYGRDRARLALVLLGEVSLFSDLTGVREFRPKNVHESDKVHDGDRAQLREWLGKGCGCRVDFASTRWLTEGDFESPVALGSAASLPDPFAGSE